MPRLAMLLALLAAPAGAQNLLVNPGFEDGTAGWIVVEDRAGVVEPSATAHDGASGLLLTVPATMPGAASIAQEVRGLARGGRYCVSAWVLPLVAGSGWGLAVDEPEERRVELLSYGPATDWGWLGACWIAKRRRAVVRIWPSAGLVAGGGWVDSVALVAQ